MRFDGPQRVTNGVAWLDGCVPDWRDRINVEELNIASVTKCILGQLGWHRVPGFTIEEAEARGFVASSEDEYVAEHAELTDAWKAVLLDGTS